MEENRHMSSVDPLLYTYRLSYSKKVAHDFDWAKKVADSFDFQGNVLSRKDRKERLENYRLYNGYGVESLESVGGSMVSKEMKEEGIGGAYTRIQHHDVISQIAQAMHGEQIAQPLSVTVMDASGFSQSERRRVEMQLLQEYLQQKYIIPQQQQAMMEFMQQVGVSDPYQLPPEGQQQMQAYVAEQTEAMTPKDIRKYMAKGFKSTREMQANKLVQNLIKDLDIKFMSDYNFQNVIIDGSEFYRVGVRGGKPFMDLVNPLNFKYYSSDDKLFVQDAEWAIQERWRTISEIYNDYGDTFTKAQLKKLDTIINHNGPSGNALHSYNEFSQSTIIGSVGWESYKKDIKGIDPRTATGQQQLRHIDAKYANQGDSYNKVRECHIVWRSQRRLKCIDRVDQNGELETFFVDESYTFNPLKGDLKQKDIWVNEVWECTKIGFLDAIYVNVRPVPYQYRSLKNPRDTKLPYYGAEYFKLMGNSENTSPLQKGKNYQYDINLTMAKIREAEATDLGKVLLMSMAAKPDEWSWDKFVEMIRYTKMVPLDMSKEGMTDVMAQLFKAVDLSSVQEMAGKIQWLEWLIGQAARAMSFNSARLGQTQQYATAQNNQQNLARSLSQTASIYSMHNKIIRDVLEALLNASRIAYKDNKEYFANILDDGQLAELELDPELLWSSEMSVYVSNAGEDLDNINMIKQNLMNFVQNGLGLPDSIRVLWSKSGAELYNIAEEIEDKQMKAQQDNAQQMQNMQATQQQMEQDLARVQAEFKMMMQDKELAAKLEVAAISATTLRQASDINNNNENDYLERQAVTDEMNKEKYEKELAFQKEKFLKEMEIKNKELEIKEKAIKNKPKTK